MSNKDGHGHHLNLGSSNLWPFSDIYINLDGIKLIDVTFLLSDSTRVVLCELPIVVC